MFAGVAIQEVCTAQPRTCSSDAECSDNNACNGLEICDLSIPHTTVCHITIVNASNDSVTVKNAFDVIKPFAIDQAIIPDLPIESVSGNTTCVVGGQPLLATQASWCVVGPATAALGVGSVTFISNSYVPLATDPDPLPDQSTVVVADNCDAVPETPNCSTSDNNVSFSAQTDLVSGCVPGTPLNCNDSNACTTDACDPVNGCSNTPIVCNDNNACTTDTCDPVNGCQATPISCDDNNVCTTDTCNPATGCVNTENDLCAAPTGCRITAGGITPNGNVDAAKFAEVSDATFGGQVGAPCGCVGPGGFEGFDSIQGNWTFMRKGPGVGSFHATGFNSLVCGCDPSPQDSDGVLGNLQNLLTGQLCNPRDRGKGPFPPNAPANLACFTGIGGVQRGVRTADDHRGLPS